MNDSPQVNSIVVYELLQELRTDVRDQHARIRADLTAGLMRIADENREHLTMLTDHHGRLTALETQGGQQQHLSTNRLSVLIAAISSGTYLGWQIILLILKRIGLE